MVAAVSGLQSTPHLSYIMILYMDTFQVFSFSKNQPESPCFQESFQESDIVLRQQCLPRLGFRGEGYIFVTAVS